MGDTGIAQGKGGANALIQKVSGEYKIKLRLLHLRFFSQGLQSDLLHSLFTLLPGLLAEIGIADSQVKCAGERPLGFFFSCNTCPVCDHRRLGKDKALPAALIFCHVYTLFVGFAVVCAKKEEISKNMISLYISVGFAIIRKKGDEKMGALRIRTALPEDLPKILEIYACARSFMASHGNPTQWGTSRPGEQTLRADIGKQELYVVCGENGICGAFAFIPGEDPTYARIDGAWHYSDAYAVIHRMASDGSQKGIFAACMDYCKARASHLRIDTHKDNQIMQHLIAKAGFSYCGIIATDDGTPRLAYDFHK